MSFKKLSETLEVQIALTGQEFLHDNMFAMWAGVPYGQLSVLLVHLRYLAFVHQTHHWQSKGDSFYGDHLLFERLYNAVVPEIDAIAEKAVGLGGTETVKLSLQTLQLAHMVEKYGAMSTIPQPSELAKRSLVAEFAFLKCAAATAASLREAGTLTRGLDNMIAGLEDTHEGHCYLLKQRCNVGMR